MSYVLRKYQEETVQAARAALRAGKKSVLICLPTGGGKGAIIAWIVSEALAKGNRVLFVVHRRELVLDVRDRIKRMGIDKVKVLLGGEAEGDLDALVTVASIQTLDARDVVPEAELLITDEAHHATSLTYAKLYAQYPATTKHLGFTATPQRADKTPLGDVFDELVHVVGVAQLTEEGHLVPAKVIAPPRRKEALALGPVDAVLKYAEDKRSVVFTSTVAQAEDIVAGLGAHEISAAVVSGNTPKREREAILARWASGEIQVVANCAVLTEGFDLPAIEVCILARKCGSVSMYLQCVGRALRPSPGKTLALIVDLFGAAHEHGLPTDERVFSLKGEPIKLKGKPPPLKQCPDCGAVFRPVPVCPICSYEFPPPEPPELDPDKLQVLHSVKAMVVERRTFYLDQLQHARHLGLKDGWAAHRYRERYGDWPPTAWKRMANKSVTQSQSAVDATRNP